MWIVNGKQLVKLNSSLAFTNRGNVVPSNHRLFARFIWNVDQLGNILKRLNRVVMIDPAIIQAEIVLAIASSNSRCARSCRSWQDELT